MTNPHDHDDDDVASYLRTFGEDVVPPHAKKRALAALGLRAVTIGSATAVASTAMGAGRLTALAVVKSIAGGAVVGAMVLGASSYVQERAAATASSAAWPAPLSVLARRERRAALRGSSPAPHMVVAPALAPDQKVPSTYDAPLEPAPSQEVAMAPPVLARRPASLANSASVAVRGDRVAERGGAALPQPSAVATPEVRPSALAREVLMLDQTRAALARRDAVSARALLDAYALEFASGKLRPEAQVLQIETLLLQGDVAGARALARAFEEAHPGDSHLRRIHSLLTP